MQSTTVNRIAIGVMLALTLGLIVFFITNSTLPLGERYRPIYEYGGPFTLQSIDGPVSLSEFEGKVVVMYFGFLSCTEACPASMSVLKRAFGQLSDEELAQIQAIFISVDPERDSVENLQQFAEYYHPNMIGLTDSKRHINEVTKQYGVFFELIDLEGSASSYTVDHSSRFYIIDKEGVLITTMSHTTRPIELAAKLKSLL